MLRFTGYDQSSKCLQLTDSSVSYAAAVVTIAAAEEDGAEGCS